MTTGVHARNKQSKKYLSIYSIADSEVQQSIWQVDSNEATQKGGNSALAGNNTIPMGLDAGGNNNTAGDLDEQQ